MVCWVIKPFIPGGKRFCFAGNALGEGAQYCASPANERICCMNALPAASATIGEPRMKDELMTEEQSAEPGILGDRIDLTES